MNCGALQAVCAWLGGKPSLFKIVPLDFQFLSENLFKYQICFNPFNNLR